MDDFKPELMKALLDWINTFELPGRVTSWSQLEDGQILWQILSDIDPSYFGDSLPNFDDTSTHRRTSTSDNWIPRWQNLKHIERAVSAYIREECEQLPVLTKRMIPDLKTGARDGSMMLTAKLTMAVLLASLYSPRSNQKMIQVMSELGTKTAETIAEAIQDMQALDARMAALGMEQELTPDLNPSGYRTPTRAVSGAAAVRGSSVERDVGLEQEAQLIEANKERHALREKVEQMKREAETAKQRVEKLEEELVEARLHLDTRGSLASADDLENLRNDLTRDRQYIAELEGDLANAREILEGQKRRLQRAEAEEPAKQEMRDQLQLIRAERDELSQKAKANENLKKKIQALTHETKALETLREEYQSARERLQELENVEERCAALEKVHKENSQTLVQSEQDIFEEKGKRQRLEHENLLLMKQLEQTRELQYKAEEAKRELEDRIRELESSNHVGGGGSLEDELAQGEGTENGEEPPSARTLTDSRTSADAIALQQKVEILSARLKSLEGETLKQMQENLGLRSDIMTSKDEESQRPFLEQNEKLQATETELENLRRRLREKELETVELRNELNKKSNISEDTKTSDLQAEHDRLLTFQQKMNQRLRELELINEEKTGLLRTALLDRDLLSPALLELQKAETLQRVREQIERVTNTPVEIQPKVLDVTASEIADTILSSQAALDKAKKDIRERESALDALKVELEKAREESGEKGSPELLQELENLRRENRLITSAWYDMTTRLQSNTVVLQRKSEAPKSWLGKQRVVVGGGASNTRR